MWWWLAACEEPREAPPVPEDTGATSSPTGADLALALDAHDERVVVPCELVWTARVVNEGAADHAIDEVRLDGGTHAWVFTSEVDVPRVLHPGDELEIPVHVGGDEPGPIEGTLTVETDAGRLEAMVRGALEWGPTHEEQLTVPLPAVDVILAVDHGDGMSAYADGLAEGVAGWLDALTLAADWRLILVTDDDGCRNGRVFTTSAEAAPWIAAHAFDVGRRSVLTEALLQLASQALSNDAPGECNATFRRPSAQLQVVVLSDEPDQSSEAWDWWVADYHRYADVASVSGVVDARARCGRGAAGYEDAAAATGGVLVDLCDADWSDRLDRLADGVVPVPPSLVLPGDAAPTSIHATIDGVEVGASYDEATRTVTLAEPVPPGTVVELQWADRGTCP